jgi:hypothetical protein
MQKTPDYVRLYHAFRNHALYPKGREFTEYEAWLDVLLKCYPEGIFFLDEEGLTIQWGWTPEQLHLFIRRLTDLKLLTHKEGQTYHIVKKSLWYSPEAEHTDINIAPQVVIEFNRIMGRKVSLNPTIERYIKARIREGRKHKPPVGLQQFISVFEHMKHVWTVEEPTMSKYLELETLCSGKFFKYLEKARVAYRSKVDKTFNAFTK